jgi:ADP-ribose pyrophosphatase YjhB (NUDIX family)
MKAERPFLAVRAIITDENNKVLILKRDNTLQGDGKWCLTGGNIEYGQSASDAVKNEIKEETSLICEDLKFLFYLENMPSEESDLHYVTLVFLCSVTGTLKLNSESSDYAWIRSDEIAHYDFAFKNDNALSQYWQINGWYNKSYD